MSTAVATKTHHTPEDLLAMPDGKSYELVRGQLVERNTGVESSWVGSRILVRLGHFCEEHKLGWALQADCGYQRNPGRVDLGGCPPRSPTDPGLHITRTRFLIS